MENMKERKPSVRAEIITRRTYNRPTNDSGTEFESWEDTVGRVLEHQKWLWERAKGCILSLEQIEELATLGQLMIERKVSVSGRTLWLGGTSVAKTREASQFNPLKYDTEIVTTDGVFQIGDFADGETISVPTHLGNIKSAVVSDSGIRDMVNITFNKARTKNTVSSCLDHTWILNDGSRVLAKDLKIGDKVYKGNENAFDSMLFEEMTPAQQYYWCYGFVYGDGSLAKSGKSVTSRVRLCGDKQKYLERFIACGFEFSYPPSCHSDPFVWTGLYLKTLPDTDDIDIHKAFLRGYMDADGNKKNRRGERIVTGISMISEDARDYVMKYMPVFGKYISNECEVSRDTNFGQFNGYKISFHTFAPSGGHLYTVSSIEQAEREQCYCLTVEEDHSFILSNGVVSGNCSFTQVETVYDVVDCLWLLLQGCGVGFTPVRGTLNGFMKPIKQIEVIRSTRTGKGGDEFNSESWDADSKVWTISIGDSAESWAKSIGKLLAGKFAADKLILDFSNIRPSGERLKGYGWISSGDEAIAKAYVAIAELMNKKAGSLLTAIDILDIINWLGTVLSSRRSAEIALLNIDDPEWREFALAKKDRWLHGNQHREQSNNSLVFYRKPSKKELGDIFELIVAGGGSEPGFINGEAALKRAPWFKGCNPCAEILLGNKSFCNLTEVDIGKFKGDSSGLREAVEIAARANYRQTCVNLIDGVLQEAWHLNNEFLRLCGVGLTGIARRGDLTAYDYAELQRVATSSAYGMANELGTQLPKNITTVKPSGTLSKIMDTTEGVHKPLGRYIFNNVNFSKHDPILSKMREAGYKVIPNPVDPEGILVTFPVEWDDVNFETVNGVEVNTETAVAQLERYKLLQNNWTQQNTSVTISYSVCEIPEIIDWLLENWDLYVGVSFIYRADPSKTAKDLGYMYLPQEVVTKKAYDDYVSGLSEVVVNDSNTLEEIKDEECAGGVCPVK